MKLYPFAFVLLLAVIWRLATSVLIYSGDLNNHIGWARSILTQGFSGAYDRQYTGIMQPTYPPLSLMAFTTSTGIYQLTYDLCWYLNSQIPAFPSRLIWALEDEDVLPAFNKTIAVAADVGIGVLIFMFVHRIHPNSRYLPLLASSAYLFNPAVWYTSSIWGQIESFPLFFVILSFWLVYRGFFKLAHVSFVAALLSKQSSIIFIPIFFLLSFQRFGIQATLRGLALQAAVFYLAFIPFFSSPNPFWPVTTYINRVQTGSGSNWVTDHAFNPWVWLTRMEKIPDTTPVLGSLSAGMVGLTLFAFSTGLVLLRYLKSEKTLQLTFICASLIVFLSFLLLTKMHERYLAPVLPFLVLTSALSSPWFWLIYAAVSTVHLANLYHNWWYPRIPALVTWLSQNSTIDILIVILLFSTVLTTLKYVWKT